MLEHATGQRRNPVIVQIQLDQVHQTAEIVINHRANVVQAQIEHFEAGDAPKRVHTDLLDVRSADVQLLQLFEML